VPAAGQSDVHRFLVQDHSKQDSAVFSFQSLLPQYFSISDPRNDWVTVSVKSFPYTAEFVMMCSSSPCCVEKPKSEGGTGG